METNSFEVVPSVHYVPGTEKQPSKKKAKQQQQKNKQRTNKQKTKRA